MNKIQTSKNQSNVEILDGMVFLTSVTLVLEMRISKNALWLFPDGVYFVLTFDPLFNLHLGIWKLLKNCFVCF